MCGRFARYTPDEEIADIFETENQLQLPLRFNVAPTQAVAAVGRTRDGRRKLAALRWGLVPARSDGPTNRAATFNARAETLSDKPSFRDSFARRRCLIPADGFFEWDNQKQPVYFYMESRRPFAFAGLWDTWKGAETIHSCAIITTTPNSLLRPLHDRMPVILDPEDYDPWLDPRSDIGDVRRLLRPYQAALMASHPVSRLVNSVRIDEPSCVLPVNLSLLEEAH